MPDLDSSILLAFLDAEGEPVSGDRLAKELGVSRVAIWSRLERIRAAGFVFAASTRKGYVLRAVPRQLDHALLDAHLRRLKVAPKVEFLAAVDSTNSEARCFCSLLLTGCNCRSTRAPSCCCISVPQH